MTDHASVLHRHGYHALRVKQVVQETADTRSYVLDVPTDLSDLFTYRAGQFCTFRVSVDGEELIRCYSMSSSPETEPHLTVTVKRVPGGRVSNWFHDVVAEGDVLEVMKPGGVFCLREEDRPVVAFCAGSGVTPVISIAKTALATTERPVKLLYANRSADSVIFAAELDELARQNADRMELRHHLDADNGYLQPADVLEFVGPTMEADFYVCGPDPFMDLVESTLLEAGVTADRIAIERFGATPLSEADGEDSAAADEPAETPSSVTLVVRRRKTTVDYHAGDTILLAARRGGVQTPSSCEAGTCASCMALLMEGTAVMRANDALTPEEVEEGWVLTCQAVPTSKTITVDFES
jgi:3-ketosteroid 9alpha-monooxygenase subunit B